MVEDRDGEHAEAVDEIGGDAGPLEAEAVDDGAAEDADDEAGQDDEEAGESGACGAAGGLEHEPGEGDDREGAADGGERVGGEEGEERNRVELVRPPALWRAQGLLACNRSGMNGGRRILRQVVDGQAGIAHDLVKKSFAKIPPLCIGTVVAVRPHVSRMTWLPLCRVISKPWRRSTAIIRCAVIAGGLGLTPRHERVSPRPFH